MDSSWLRGSLASPRPPGPGGMARERARLPAGGVGVCAAASFFFSFCLCSPCLSQLVFLITTTTATGKKNDHGHRRQAGRHHVRRRVPQARRHLRRVRQHGPAAAPALRGRRPGSDCRPGRGPGRPRPLHFRPGPALVLHPAARRGRAGGRRPGQHPVQRPVHHAGLVPRCVLCVCACFFCEGRDGWVDGWMVAWSRRVGHERCKSSHGLCGGYGCLPACVSRCRHVLARRERRGHGGVRTDAPGWAVGRRGLPRMQRAREEISTSTPFFLTNTTLSIPHHRHFLPCTGVIHAMCTIGECVGSEKKRQRKRGEWAHPWAPACVLACSAYPTRLQRGPPLTQTTAVHPLTARPPPPTTHTKHQPTK
jgi:hypothetical protein